MADLQQHGAQSDAASLGPQPEVYMPVDSVSNGLKRAAPEGDDSEAPEAKQARLDDAAAQGSVVYRRESSSPWLQLKQPNTLLATIKSIAETTL